MDRRKKKSDKNPSQSSGEKTPEVQRWKDLPYGSEPAAVVQNDFASPPATPGRFQTPPRTPVRSMLDPEKMYLDYSKLMQRREPKEIIESDEEDDRPMPELVPQVERPEVVKRPSIKVSIKLSRLPRFRHLLRGKDYRHKKFNYSTLKFRQKPQVKANTNQLVGFRTDTIYFEATKSSGYCVMCETFYRDIHADRDRHTENKDLLSYELVPLRGHRVLLPALDNSEFKQCSICRVFCFEARFPHHKCAEYVPGKATRLGRGDFYCVMCQTLFPSRLMLGVHWHSVHKRNQTYAVEDISGLKTLVPGNTNLAETLQFCCNFCQVFTCKNRPEVKCSKAEPIPAFEYLTTGD